MRGIRVSCFENLRAEDSPAVGFLNALRMVCFIGGNVFTVNGVSRLYNKYRE